jgi:hypothetical protein
MLDMGLRSALAGGIASGDGIGRKLSCSSANSCSLSMKIFWIPWPPLFVEIDFGGVDLRITV